jgi:nicotinate-nucleotide adenylyltransferase
VGGPRARRVGLLGGTFDPPHRGHLWLAERAVALLALDAVRLVPAYRPPHKDPAALSDWADRLAMAELLAAESPRLEVSDVERELGGGGYTIDLVRHLQAEAAGETFVLLIGEDSLRDMDTWREPDRLFATVEVAVFAREGFATAPTRPCRVLAGETHPASSRAIRAKVAAGEPTPWLTDPVRDYVERRGLYRARPGKDAR